MLNILSSFINTMMSIVNYMVNAVNNLINLFSHIPAYVTFLTTSVAVLPSFIIPYAICAIGICVVLFIIGR